VPLRQVVTNYAVDRTTMLATKDYPERWASNEGFVPREGIVLSWPLDTESTDASVEAARADAEGAGSKLQLYGTTLTWIGVGAVLLMLGPIVHRRKTA